MLTARGLLYTVSDNAAWLLAVQALDGIGAGIFGALFPIVIADLTRGSGRFNVAQGAVATVQGARRRPQRDGRRRSSSSPRDTRSRSGRWQPSPASAWCSTPACMPETSAAGQRRCRAISASTTPAATDAFSDSVGPAIGIDTIASQFSRTRRDSPLPSEPTTTTIGPRRVELVEFGVAAGVETDHLQARVGPALAACGSGWWPAPTRSRAAAPALVRHATAVTDADRRCGISTPWPPNAATDRTIAPRLRGIGDVVQRHQQRRRRIRRRRPQHVVGVRVVVRRHLQRDALVQTVGADAGPDRASAPRGSRCPYRLRAAPIR